jgi:cellulose synthase/poly-beta-1,6-N-acetylglucosamine synthase-like glycosyltransferase
MKKIIAVIPVYGRIPLLKYTIGRLLNKNCCFKVICVGATDEEKNECEKAGAEFIFHENNPLGKKWNYGFKHAKQYNPDACLFVGSGDWICDDWLSKISPYLDTYDLIGKKDFYLMDFGNTIRCCHWLGYDRQSRRHNESIGIGRIISKRILNKIDWKPFVETKNNSMDFTMYQNVLSKGGKHLLIHDDELISLSTSTNLWNNKHVFEDHWNNKLPTSNKILYKKPIFELFPEALEFYADIQK